MFGYHNGIKKKGNLDDIPQALVIVLGFVFVFFLVSTIVGEFNSAVSTNSQTNSSEEAMEFLDTYESRYNKGWDYAVLFLAILLPVFSYISARRIPTKPSTMIIVFFLAIFFIIIGMITANIYGKMLENATFSAWVSGLTFIPFIMPNLLYYTIIYLIIVVIGLFSKEEGTI